MALVEIHADLTRVAKALEKLVAILERVYPEPAQAPRARRTGIEHVTRITDEDRVERELEKIARQARGQD